MTFCRTQTEEKLRRRQQVWKRRLPCRQDELAAIVQGATSLEGDREWFRTRFQVLRLKPRLIVLYQRQALVGPGDERLTVDRCIDAFRVDNGLTSFVEDKGTPQRIIGLDVLELKHPVTRSALMRELTEMAGEAQGCSKYGLGMRAFGYGRAKGRLTKTTSIHANPLAYFIVREVYTRFVNCNSDHAPIAHFC
ncbi:MAG: hypothetical protein IIA07_13115 [Proteobacteria bacterium]|nr:hypothetical protein [Pseudomonadota bacterium]